MQKLTYFSLIFLLYDIRFDVMNNYDFVRERDRGVVKIRMDRPGQKKLIKMWKGCLFSKSKTKNKPLFKKMNKIFKNIQI